MLRASSTVVDRFHATRANRTIHRTEAIAMVSGVICRPLEALLLMECGFRGRRSCCYALGMRWLHRMLVCVAVAVLIAVGALIMLTRANRLPGLRQMTVGLQMLVWRFLAHT